MTFTGNELNSIHDMKKLSLIVTQAIIDEVQSEMVDKRKIQITTSNSLIIADEINMKEPKIENLTLLETALLKSEDIIFLLIKDSKVTNIFGMIVLKNVKIIPFANPNNVIDLESYALFTDHIMGFSLTE